MADDTPRFGLGRFEQGDQDWDHTDTVEAVDEHAIARGSIADRPDTGEYDDELYYATDQNVLWGWDADASDWAVRGGTGSSEQPIPDFHTEVVRTTGDEPITINVPSDEPTLNEAVQQGGEYKPKSGIQVEVYIESGHTLEGDTVFCPDGYYGHIAIISEDDIVQIGSDWNSENHFIVVSNGSCGPQLHCQIDAQGNCADGYRLLDASKGYINGEPNDPAGVRNAGRKGLYVLNASSITANFCDFSGAGMEGCDVFRASHATVLHGDFSDAGLDGVRAARGAIVEAGEIDASAAARDGVRVAGREAKINAAPNADLRNAGRNGARATRHGRLTIHQCDARGATEEAIYVARKADVNCRNATLSDDTNPVGGDGVAVLQSGDVALGSSTITHAGGSAITGDDNAEIGLTGADLSNATDHAIRVKSCREIIGRNVTAQNCGNGVRATDTTMRINDIDATGCGGPIRADEGAYINIQDGIVDTAAFNDLQVYNGSKLNADRCTTSASTNGYPHEDDISLTTFNEVHGAGIIFTESFESP